LGVIAARARHRNRPTAAPELRSGRLRVPVEVDGEMAKPEKALPVGHRQEVRRLVRSLGMEDVRIHDLRHTGPSVLLMQGIPGDVVRRR